VRHGGRLPGGLRPGLRVRACTWIWCARQQLEGAQGKWLEIVALIQVLSRARPHELILDGRHRRLWLYFAGNCRYEPQGMAPACRPDLPDGWLDIRAVEARCWEGRAWSLPR
jgi:hypothetical protein